MAGRVFLFSGEITCAASKSTTPRSATAARAKGSASRCRTSCSSPERLDRLGFDFVEGGYPLSNEKDAQYFQRVRRARTEHARVCAFGMTRRKGITADDDPGMKALLDSGAGVITIVGKTSDFHVTEVLRRTLEENLAMIGDSVAYLRRQGREVIYDAEHFFDGWKANPELRRARPSRRRPRPAPRWSCSATPTAAACPRKSPS